MYHLERVFVLAYNAVLKRSDRRNITGGSAEHLLSLTTDLQDLIRILINSNYRRFFQYDSFAFNVYKHRSCTEINAYIFRHNAENLLSHNILNYIIH